MTKEGLITKIQIAFNGVKLEDGIGLWEANGIDNLEDKKKLLELRGKDERNNWDHISYKDISHCQFAIYFFDAKGMKFCLPKFLIFNILQDDLIDEGDAPYILSTLDYDPSSEYDSDRFSLFNNSQIQCIMDYLEYYLDCTNSEIRKNIFEWKKKLK